MLVRIKCIWGLGIKKEILTDGENIDQNLREKKK